MAALVVCTAILAGILGHNASTGGSRIPTTIVLASDARGIPSFHGVPLGNAYVRNTLFLIFRGLDYDVIVTPPRGWMSNPAVKSNVWVVSDDVNRLGLTPGDRAIRLRQRK